MGGTSDGSLFSPNTTDMPNPPSYIKVMSEAKKRADKPLEWLFAVTAIQGTLSNEAGNYLLDIKHDDVERIVAFTDRPNRIIRLMTATGLADEWITPGSNSFKEDPPNASFASSGTPLDIIEIIDATSMNRVLRFKFRYLNSSTRKLGKIDNVVLTIDGRRIR